jgi:hypothetical protein
MKTKFWRGVAVAASLIASAAVTSTASAQFRLNIVGSANVGNQPGSGGANLLIDFLNPVLAVPSTTLPGITEFATTGTINDVVVSTSGCVNCPVIPFIQIGGYTFSLNSTPLAPAGGVTFGPVQLVATATGTTATLTAQGTVTGGAFGATTQNFIGLFSAQVSGETPADVFNSIHTGNATRFVGFSAELTTSPMGTVPEPATVALMATGLLALGAVVRVRRSQV